MAALTSAWICRAPGRLKLFSGLYGDKDFKMTEDQLVGEGQHPGHTHVPTSPVVTSHDTLTYTCHRHLPHDQQSYLTISTSTHLQRQLVQHLAVHCIRVQGNYQSTSGGALGLLALILGGISCPRSSPQGLL
jgi:hypothetical protein